MVIWRILDLQLTRKASIIELLMGLNRRVSAVSVFMLVSLGVVGVALSTGPVRGC